ncbi:hypothetical protein ACT3CD_05595 [Geofilum sp. OHC36d9]|uniref:hypothetical protein n=1 Tax=Geofilum sp. OHC36d9 TaxID=3458413 RepID=UPI004033519C
MTNLQKTITSIVAFFLLIPGLLKFSDPFKTMFTIQIEKSGLPFPHLSFIIDQSSEILTGILLYSLLYFWKKFPPNLGNQLFYIGYIMVFPIMVLAIYIHLHPNVPASLLPFESKLPLLSLTLLILSGLNLYLQQIKGTEPNQPLRVKQSGSD